jgi:OmpA-OmpF porin, OOP family
MIKFAALALLPIATSASAGIYVNGEFGGFFQQSSHHPVDGIQHTARYDPGFTVGGAVGYKLGHFRLEGEGIYSRSTIKDISTSEAGARRGYGYNSHYVLTGNLIYDLNLAPRWTAYAGAGVGYGHQTTRDGDTPNIDAVIPRVNVRTVKDGTDLSNIGRTGNDGIAYQFLGGVDYALNNHWSIGAKYRYTTITKIQVSVFDNLDGEIHYIYGENRQFHSSSALLTLGYHF